MLLNEGRTFGIVFGPKIPDEGYWLAGNDLRDLVQKLATGLGSGPNQQVKSFIDTLISSRYQLVTNVDGNVMAYGIEIPDLSDKAAKILNVQATTPVYPQKHYGDKKTAPTTGREAFGISMNPQEKAQLDQQKALAKAQAKAKDKWHNLTPDEEDEFNQWAKQAGKTPSGLVSRLGQPASTAPTSAAPPATPAAAPPAMPKPAAATPAPAAAPGGWRDATGKNREEKRKNWRAGRKP